MYCSSDLLPEMISASTVIPGCNCHSAVYRSERSCVESEPDLVVGALFLVLGGGGRDRLTSPLILPYLLKSYAVTLSSALSLTLTAAISSGLTRTSATSASSKRDDPDNGLARPHDLAGRSLQHLLDPAPRRRADDQPLDPVGLLLDRLLHLGQFARGLGELLAPQPVRLGIRLVQRCLVFPGALPGSSTACLRSSCTSPRACSSSASDSSTCFLDMLPLWASVWRMSNCCCWISDEFLLRHDLLLQRGDFGFAMGYPDQQQLMFSCPMVEAQPIGLKVLGHQGGIDVAEGREIDSRGP